MSDVAELVREVRDARGWTQQRTADAIGSSLAAVARWEDGSAYPSPTQLQVLEKLRLDEAASPAHPAFASRGARRSSKDPTLFDDPVQTALERKPFKRIVERVTDGQWFTTSTGATLSSLLADHKEAAITIASCPTHGMSAGKNTYTYDAHTYHTKVPPQGIAELLRHYLPVGGLVYDPFAGSGMTGVAATVTGSDCILNELSPAACFISARFASSIPEPRFAQAIGAVLDDLQQVREHLYTTQCRECGSDTELLYTVWSYRVLCSECDHEFNLWDVCRKYGRTVREHKILSEFDCPACGHELQKSRLERTLAEPVQIGYKCCGSRQREQTHPPSDSDLARIAEIEADPPLASGFYPTDSVPPGVNLGQPLRHGLDRVDKFYTPRNLAAASHVWRAIHRITDQETAAQAAFAFTSLYRRVTRFSEFRFWGGSGNTARLNVPFIFDEPNFFVSFQRKSGTISDHLATTATHYEGRCVVREGSATSIPELPDESIDLIFTDPPFGANINYSEMNLLWEAWLGRRTDTREEAIINRSQGKDLDDYQRLMRESLKESYRVLRRGHWMLLVFMNSSGRIWDALRTEIEAAGFVIVTADVFDKQHGTFKHFVSENTAGADLVLHCLKPAKRRSNQVDAERSRNLSSFLELVDLWRYLQPYLHVSRPTEVDFRRLYAEWVAETMTNGQEVVDFAEFRDLATEWLDAEEAG